MASELAEIRKELTAIQNIVNVVKETVGIRTEVDSIRNLVDIVKEVVDIRREVEDIKNEKDKIVNSQKAAPAPKKEEPKAAPAPAAAPKKEEPKAAPAAAPKKEEPKAAPAPVAAPKKEEPKAAPAPKKEEPKVAPAPAKVEEKKPEPKKDTPKAAPAPVKVEEKKPEPKAAPAAVSCSSQPPKDQKWQSGDILSTCCQDYYKLVRDDTNNINWVLMKHESNTKIRAEATGCGSLSEIIPLLGEKDTAFVYIRYTTGDEESKRAKFVLISWCGPRAPIMRKAKMSVHKADVKQIFVSSALEVHATEASDLDESAIRASLIKAGGANYNGQAQ